MTTPHFNGSDYDRLFDDRRLTSQLARIRELMRDGVWRTLAEIAAATHDPAASISAQLRHLRKPRFGSYLVDKRARGGREHGLFEYRLRARTNDADVAETPTPPTMAERLAFALREIERLRTENATLRAELAK